MSYIVTEDFRLVQYRGVRYREHRAEGDGNCLFHSLAFLLHRDYDVERAHGLLRADAAGWIRERLVANDEAITRQALEYCTPTEEPLDYADRLLRDREWGDSLCILAIATLQTLDVRVMTRAGGETAITPAATPRIARIAYRGNNHFNPLLPSPEGDLEAEVEVEVEALSPPSGPPSGATRYWIRQDVLRPYTPLICQNAYRVDASLASRRKASLLVALWHRNTSAETLPSIARIVLENFDPTGKEAPLRSKSYEAGAENGAPERTLVAEPLILPVRSDDGWKTVTPVTERTRLEFMLVNPLRAESIVFEVLAPKGADVEVPAPVTVLQAELAVAKNWPSSAGGAGQLYQVALGAVFGDKAVATLNWRGSPYKLQLKAYSAGETLASVAWTYFHVPAPSDAGWIEAIAPQAAIFQGHNMAAVGGVRAAVCDDEGMKALAPTDGQIAAFNQRAQRAAAGKKFAKLMQEGDFELAKKSQLEKLQEQKARAQKFAEDREAAPIVRESSRKNVVKLEEEIEALRRYELDPEAEGHEANGFSLQGTTTYFGDNLEHFALSWACVAVFRIHENAYRPVSVYLLSRDFIVPSGNYNDRIQPLSKLSVTNPGNRAEQWDVFRVPERLQLPITRAITYAVSTCAWGVTFPNEERPEYLVFSHLDNPTSVPISHALKRILKAKPEYAKTGFRTVLSAVASADEMVKYQPQNIFPEEARAASKVLLLPRESNLFAFPPRAKGSRAVPIYTHDAIGLRFEAGPASARMIGLYHSSAGLRAGLVGGAVSPAGKCACGNVAHQFRQAHHDLLHRVHGTTPLIEKNNATLAEFIEFRKRVTGSSNPPGLPEIIEAVKEEQRSYESEPIGSALFEKMEKGAAAFEDWNVMLIGQAYEGP